MTGNTNKLFIIPKKSWPSLMDMYKIDWPKHFVTYYTIDNYIKWNQKSIQNGVDDKFKFYSLNDDWTDGTHMIIDSTNHVFFNTLEKSASFSRLSQMLQLLTINKDNFYLFAFVDRLEPVVTRFMNRNNLIDDGGNMAYLNYLDKENAIKFDISPPNGYSIKPLKPEHAIYANNLWIYKHPGSDEYLRNLIEKNLNLGIFDENDTLIAWCFRVEYGLLGTLQVAESHKRQGFGTLIVKALAKLSAEHGYDSGSAMDIKNVPSQNLFKKLGFSTIKKFHYVVPKPK